MDPNNLGPYRATKLWTNAISAFRNGMPLKRHWKHMRVFEQCFTASEAIDWLHLHLQNNPDFGPEVTRAQTIRLLQKFLKCHVFISIGGDFVKPEEFSDNKVLYRFTQGSPFKLLRTPLRVPLRDHTNNGNINNKEKKDGSGDDKLSQCHLIPRTLTIHEREETWKAFIVNRLQTTLGLPEIDAILDSSSVNPKFIIHNLTQVNRNGVVIVLDKSYDLPHWVISAMKCLINWPNFCENQSSLPKYEGFENDVFKVVKEYFQNHSTPLSTYAMYDVFINCLVRAEYLDVGVRPASAFGSYLPAELSSFESVENFMNDIVPKRPKNFSKFKTSTPCLANASPCCCHMCLEINQPSAIGKEIQSTNSKIQMQTCRPFNMCYETAFTSANPITRIIPECNILPRMAHPTKQSTVCVRVSSHDPLTDDSDISSVLSSARCNRKKLQPPLQPKNFPNDSITQSDRALRRLRSKSGGYYNLAYLMPSNENIPAMENHSDGSSSGSYHTAEEEPVNILASEMKSDNGGRLTENSPSDETDPHFSCTSNYFTATDRYCTNSNSWIKHDNNFSDYLLLIAEGLPDYNSHDILKQHAIQEWVEKACWPDLFSEVGRDCAIEALQLVSLLLPPSNRRKLHLLLRFMNKISNNHNLTLSSNIPTRILVLQTFLRCIVNSRKNEDYDELLALRLVTFLMDHYERIFSIPQALKHEMEEKLRNEKVSNGEYMKQCVDLSQRALADLLERIINDQKLSQKTKKKHLKQFKLSYPDIYQQRFPSPQEEAAVIQMKSKNNSRSSLLQRLKIRL